MNTAPELYEDKEGDLHVFENGEPRHGVAALNALISILYDASMTVEQDETADILSDILVEIEREHRDLMRLAERRPSGSPWLAVYGPDGTMVPGTAMQHDHHAVKWAFLNKYWGGLTPESRDAQWTAIGYTVREVER